MTPQSATLATAAPVALLGGVLLVLAGGPEAWGYWFACGLLIDSFVLAIYPMLFLLKLIRGARKADGSMGTG